ncbi:hypothetical protein DXG03_002907 [Asterophora parasitica]|uniref:Beta-mannosidase B n=1 Tax=Asterophora parasitica TaxID=117018 RepID=A0A9P7KDI8_9AGAR|nr:hypothetical protein DXG03_002907 [Asterophora parasitica]
MLPGVGESEWAFKSSFIVTSEELNSSKVDLVFDSLDTFAKIELNGRRILETSNQFVSHRVAVKDTLKAGQNELVLTFESAFLKGRDIEKQHDKLSLWNGDSSRLHVRKAQYKYVLSLNRLWSTPQLTRNALKVTAGIGPISLQFYKNRIVDLDVRSDVSEARDVKLSAKFTFSEKAPGFASFALKAPDGSIKASATKIPSDVGHANVAFEFEAGKLDLWYPVGYGKQPLYTVETELSDEVSVHTVSAKYSLFIRLVFGQNGEVLDTKTLRIAFRRARVVQDKLVDQEGRKQRGYGIENIPVFMISTPRLADYQLAESLNLELDYDDETSDFRDTNFPARHIYERTLPEIVHKLSDIYYHRGSPYSGQGKPTTDKTLGDLHQWNVWHGSQEPWHNWDILAGRFVSEFGMEGYPNIRTVDYWLGGDKSERFPQSRTNNNHNKASGFERRLELYLVENFKHSFEMESYVYYTQIMQAETLASAYRKLNASSAQPLLSCPFLPFPQINDCWPVTSWAIVDYFLRPKPAFFTVARELRPFTVGMTRKEHKTFADDRSMDKFTIETRLEIWGTNSSLTEKKATLEVASFDLDSERRDKWSKEVVLAQNASTELFKGQLHGQPIRTKLSEVPKVIVVSARLIDEDGELETNLIAMHHRPEPFKFIRFPPVKDLGLKAIISADGESVTLSTNKPIKGIVLDVEGDDVKWSDQAIDLVPDDPQTIRAVGLNGREVKLRYLGDGSA